METPVTVTLDLAAAFSAILWPVAAVVIVLALRRYIPEALQKLPGSVKKIGFGNFSLELAEATGFTPDWSGEAKFDLRRQASAADINDSTQRTFESQLQTESPADYAIVNLGTGCEWLTSRLYIMAIIFARMNGMRAFVFLETTPATRKKFIGWAEPQTVRWALARRYPEYENAYADAYSLMTATAGMGAVVVSSTGRLGFKHDPLSAYPGIELLKEFLTRIQMQATNPPPTLPPNADEWQMVDVQQGTVERGEWIDGELIESILKGELHTTAIVESEIKSVPPEKQAQMVMEHRETFVALVDTDRRFVGMVERDAAISG